MAANINPIFTITGNLASDGATGMAPTITTATGDYTGVSANHAQVAKGNSNGTWLERLRFKATGSNVPTVARVYINNGSTHTSATNNSFYDEITLPQTVATNVAATTTIDMQMGIVIPSGWTVWVGLATTVASGWVVSSVGGDY